jgi:hypothetical protein
MSSLIQDLDKIRELQGRDPLPDPTVIQGFGPGSAPVPNYDPDVPAEWLDPELDQHDPRVNLPPSPLIPQSAPVPAPVAMPNPSVAAEPARSMRTSPQSAEDTARIAELQKVLELVELLSWNGQPAPLSDEDRAGVRAIVLRSVQRRVAADLEAVAPTKRKRRTIVRHTTGTLATGPATGVASWQDSVPTIKNDPLPNVITNTIPKRKRGRPRKNVS